MKSLHTSRKKKGFTLVELIVVIGILGVLGSIGYPWILAQANSGDRTKAQNNLKQAGNMMDEFREKQGSYPCDATAEKFLDSEYDFGELTGDYSNAYFRQLFHEKGTDGNSEKTFFAKINVDGRVSVEGDGKIANGRALTKGENGMAYFMKTNSEEPGVKFPVTRNSEPLLATSVFPSKDPYKGQDIKVDTNSFRGHFFVYYPDKSVKDMEPAIKESDTVDEQGIISTDDDKAGVYPQNKAGQSFPDRYIILSPEL